MPVAEISAEARRAGIDIVCDAAQSWGLLDYTVDELGVDWAAFNLHKWIGTPVGVGALYMRRGSLEKIAPYPGEDPEWWADRVTILQALGVLSPPTGQDPVPPHMPMPSGSTYSSFCRLLSAEIASMV